MNSEFCAFIDGTGSPVCELSIKMAMGAEFYW